MKCFRLFLAAALLTAILANASAQVGERERGIKLYKQGNDVEAVAVLEKISKQKAFASDAEVLNYLGLAYSNTDDHKKARKTLEKAVKLSTG